MTAFRVPGVEESLRSLRVLFEAYAARTPVETIAVVANAPLEPSAERAAAIDATDLVLRVNGLRTDVGGEPTVGSRTEVVLFQRRVHPTPWLFSGYREKLFVAMQSDRIYWADYRAPDWWPDDLGFVSLDNCLALQVAYDSGAKSDGFPLPTSGAVATWLAVNLFPEAHVWVTGLSFLDNPNQNIWAHATGAAQEIVSWMHDLHHDADLIRRYVADERVSII